MAKNILRTCGSSTEDYAAFLPPRRHKIPDFMHFLCFVCRFAYTILACLLFRHLQLLNSKNSLQSI